MTQTTDPSQGGAPTPALRILMIAPTSFFADYGCHVRILEEARFLQGLGHYVTICTYNAGRNPSGLTIHRSMGVPWRTNYEVGSSRHKVAMDILLLLRALRSMILVRPDVIHGHIHEGALIGLVLSRMFGCPLVCDLQGSLTAEMIDHRFVRRGSRAHKAFRWAEGVIVHSARRILTSTLQNAGVLRDEFGCAPDRITYVPDCVSTDTFCARPRDAHWEAYRAMLGIPAGRKVIVYLGLLAEYQGTDHLLRAASMLCQQRDDVHFLIAGFPSVEHYQQMAERLGVADHCTFTGKVPYEEAATLLAQGDVAVSPKISATEGAGKLLNYMAMGLPTVAFDTSVSREYLGELGIYAAVGDTADLARCIEMALEVATRGDLAPALRQRARERYDWAISGAQIVEAYADQIELRRDSKRSV
ncbi:MAG: glycosyltransferase family 4 protein [Anaerolineae bacterium]